MKLYALTYYWKNYIYEIGVDNGEKFIEKSHFYPVIYVTSVLQNSMKDLYGNSVRPIPVSSVRKYVNEHEQEFYAGDVSENLQYIRERYPNDITDIPEIPTACIDIEIETNSGKPDVELTENKVIAISIYESNTDKKTVLGYESLKQEHDFDYIKCKSEYELLSSFWRYILTNTIILTGWNINRFDIPYLIRRSEKLHVDLKTLLPLAKYEEKYITERGQIKPVLTYKIPGYAIYDYYDLFKKYNFDSQHSFKLNDIARKYLGKNKVEYTTSYKNLDLLYRDNFDLFLDYNMKDSTLVWELEKKFGYIKIALTVSYMCKINIDEVMGTIKSWDAMLYNKFMDIGIVPPRQKKEDGKKYEGAYVKTPIAGKHKWIITEDIASLYPNILISMRVTPYSILKDKIDTSVASLLKHGSDLDFLTKNNLCLSACGNLFKRQDDPICNEVEKIYNARVEFKNLASSEKDPIKKKKYKEFVQSYKILINAFYGAMGNQYFRYYNRDVARSISITGQYIIRQIGNDIDKKINTLLKTDKKEYVIYSDTDSVFVSLDDFITKYENTKRKLSYQDKINLCLKIEKDIVKPSIDKSINLIAKNLNAYKNNLSMKFEKLADKVIMVMKKNYIMRVVYNDGELYEKPELVYKGVKLIKSTTPVVIQNDVDDIVNKLFNIDNENEFKDIMNEFKDKYKNVPIEELSIYTSLNDINKYKPKIKENNVIWEKSTPIHVRAAWVYNLFILKSALTHKYELLKDCNKVRYFFLKMPNVFQSNVIGLPEGQIVPSELNIESIIDYSTQLQKIFINNFDSITKHFNWDITQRSVVAELF